MAKRRLAAFGVDYLIIAAWIGLITGIGFGFGVRRLLGMSLRSRGVPAVGWGDDHLPDLPPTRHQA